MIVEDETDIREMLEILLMKAGFETYHAQNGQDFLNTVDQINPALITLDVMMPGITTKEILLQLQTKQCTPQIILLTVVKFSNEEIKQLSTYGNIVHCLNKPFNIQDLIDTIKKHTPYQK